LCAGLPALVIPHIADQFYWGQQVHELGVGPPPIPRNKLDVEGLAAALDSLLRDESMRVKAGALGEKIRSERGIENAVQLIEDTFA
jgi:UDP:flavonoid glycosyltransferase YjiC (YdhE family)